MLKYYFNDIGALRSCIEMLNDTIETYGCVDLNFVKELMGYKLGDEPRFTDVRFGWTEGFLEKRDVKPRLRGSRWVFEFTMPELKEL